MTRSIHATTVAANVRGKWRAVVLRGPSGSGKSDLALRLIERGAMLIADDRTILWASGGHLYARSPETISGLIEARGVGIISAPRLDLSRVQLVVDLVNETPERLPERQSTTLCGVDLPLLHLDPRPASAATLVLGAIESL